MAVVLPNADAAGPSSITVTASTPGMPPQTLTIPVAAAPAAGAGPYWCRNEPAL